MRQHVADQHAALGSIRAIPILRVSEVCGPRNTLPTVPTTPVAATGFPPERYRIVTTLLPNTRPQKPCYNDGRLVGEWIDAEDTEDITIDSLHDYLPTTLRTQVERESAHEELWCFDTSNMLQSGEMQPIDAAM